MKKLKRFICFVLSATLLISNSAIVFASITNDELPEANTQKKFSVTEFNEFMESTLNVEILSNSFENYVYTYSEGDKNYKVIEHANEDLTYVKSEIYVENSFGVFVLESSAVTEAIDNKIITEKKYDSKITKDVIDLDSMVNPVLSADDTSAKNILRGPIDDYSDWTYWATQQYSYRITTYTLVSVTAIVAYVANYFGAPGAAVAGIAGVVAYIIDDQTERVWYTVEIYYKYLLMDGGYRYKVAEKAKEWHYSDENRSQFIGVTTSENWL